MFFLRLEDYGTVILEYARRHYPVTVAPSGNGCTLMAPSPSTALGMPRPYGTTWLVELLIRSKRCYKEAERSAIPIHNYPEGIKGAQAVAIHKSAGQIR